MHRSAVAETSKFMDNLNFTYVGMVDFCFYYLLSFIIGSNKEFQNFSSRMLLRERHVST